MGNLNDGYGLNVGTNIWLQNKSSKKTKFEHNHMHWYVPARSWKQVRWATNGDVTVWADNDLKGTRQLVQTDHTYCYDESGKSNQYRGKPVWDKVGNKLEKGEVETHGTWRWKTLSVIGNEMSKRDMPYTFTRKVTEGSVKGNETKDETKDTDGKAFELTVKSGGDLWGVKVEQTSKLTTESSRTHGSTQTFSFETKDEVSIELKFIVEPHREVFICQRVLEYGSPSKLYHTTTVKAFSTNMETLKRGEVACNVTLSDIWKLPK